jgi:hypothetical protein
MTKRVKAFCVVVNDRNSSAFGKILGWKWKPEICVVKETLDENYNPEIYKVVPCEIVIKEKTNKKKVER